MQLALPLSGHCSPSVFRWAALGRPGIERQRFSTSSSLPQGAFRSARGLPRSRHTMQVANRMQEAMADSLPGKDNGGGAVAALLKIVLPSLLLGVLASVSFGPMALWLRSLLSAAVLEVLKDDVTQFLQNSLTLVLLLFGLLLGETISMLLQRQDKLYRAVYREAAQAQALVEQLTLLGAARGYGGSQKRGTELLDEVSSYLLEDFDHVGRPALLPIRRNNSADPLERLLFATSVGVPSSSICSSIRAIRQARAERLAAAQRRFPSGHFLLVGVLGAMVLGIYLLLASGLASFEGPVDALLPGHLLWLLAVLFGVLVSALTFTAGVAKELADPDLGLFGVSELMKELSHGLARSVDSRRSRELREIT